MDEHYKSLHETFVENNEGSKDPWEILLISSILPASFLLTQVIRPFFSKTPFLLETSLLSLPILLAITCCAEKSLWILLGLLGCSAGIIYYKIRKIYVPWFKLRESFLSSSGNSKKALFETLNTYRGNLLLVTCLTILAVDFPVFPRRLIKTETYGYGFMDLGVGSFVFANGILAYEARHASLGLKSIGRRIFGSLKDSSALIILGLLRLVSVKTINYQEHVTEYGVHWNFFFTLAAVKVASTLILCVIAPKHSWLVSLFFGLMHEGILSHSIGATYILDPSSPRDNLFSSNREGIMSLLGYVAIYLGAVYWGNQIQSYMNTTTTTNGSSGTCLHLLKSLVLWSFVMWGSLLYSQELFLLPSRRMANWPYFNWMLAFNLTQLAIFLLFTLIGLWFQDLLAIHQEHHSKSSRNGKSIKVKGTYKRKSSLPGPSPKVKDSSSASCSSYVLDAICFNGLPYFLLSNVLTGIINICFQTIYMMNCYAILILFVYSFTLNYLAVQLYDKKLRWKSKT